MEAYLSFNGNAADALDFYAKSLGGKILRINRDGTPVTTDVTRPLEVITRSYVPAGTGDRTNLPFVSGTVARATTASFCSDTEVAPLAIALATYPSTASPVVERGKIVKTGFRLYRPEFPATTTDLQASRSSTTSVS